MIAGIAPLLLLAAVQPAPEPAPEGPPVPVPAASPAPARGPPGAVAGPPPVPERDDYLDGEIPTNAPAGSRRGERREGEVWRPIVPQTHEKKQPVPTEDAVAQQGNPELADSLAVKKKPKRYDSPQRFALEVKFGPYLPDIDRNYPGDGFGPYAQVYGETNDRGEATSKPKNGFYGAIAFEYQIVNLAGPLGIGFQWSMMRDKAQAPLAEPPTDEKLSVPRTAHRTTFAVMPMALQAVYRFELLADRFRVPLVPYAKIGLNYSFWWSKNGNNDISTIIDEGTGKVTDKARGGAWGFQTNIGGMIRLDFIERASARSLDRTTGINHTYVFAEWQLSRVNNFGRKNSINLGDSTWLVGLAVEF